MSDFRMPALGADMDAGTVIEWRVAPGDEVRRGDIMAVIQTDKADVEVETFSSGVVEDIVVPVGQKVPVGELLAHLRAPSAQRSSRRHDEAARRRVIPARPSPGPAVPLIRSPIIRHLAEAAHVDLATLEPSGPGGQVTRADVEAAAARQQGAPPPPRRRREPAPARQGGHPVSPRARRLAAARGVDLSCIDGSGPGGAVTGDDIERHSVAQPAGPPFAVAEQPITAEVAPEADRLASLRAAVARLMARSKTEIPHYYLSTTVDMSGALRWLDEQNATRPVTRRMLAAAVLLGATAHAARRIPQVNGFWEDGRFQAQAEVHLGVAVSIRGGGLIAPTIAAADQLSLDELMERLRELVAHARSGGLRASEMRPPTITVTNLGDEGVDAVFPIIYPPQVAMVGFGKIAPRPWAADGMLGVRPTVTVSLAADHRVSDGHTGARFLGLLDRLLQEPQKL